MIDYFKLFLYSTFYITKNNLGKLILVILSIISFNYAGTFEDVKYEAEVAKEINIDGIYLYITKDIEDNEINYDVIQREKPEELKDGKITWYEYAGVNIFLWVVVVVCVVIILLLTFADDSDLHWDIRDSYKKALEKMFHTEYEDGVYYYIAFGRLMGKRSEQINRHSILYEFSVYSLSDILFHPKFQTKTEKRENLLSKIGIK